MSDSIFERFTESKAKPSTKAFLEEREKENREVSLRESRSKPSRNEREIEINSIFERFTESRAKPSTKPSTKAFLEEREIEIRGISQQWESYSNDKSDNEPLKLVKLAYQTNKTIYTIDIFTRHDKKDGNSERGVGDKSYISLNETEYNKKVQAIAYAGYIYIGEYKITPSFEILGIYVPPFANVSYFRPSAPIQVYKNGKESLKRNGEFAVLIHEVRNVNGVEKEVDTAYVRIEKVDELIRYMGLKTEDFLDCKNNDKETFLGKGYIELRDKIVKLASQKITCLVSWKSNPDTVIIECFTEPAHIIVKKDERELVSSREYAVLILDGDKYVTYVRKDKAEELLKIMKIVAPNIPGNITETIGYSEFVQIRVLLNTNQVETDDIVFDKEVSPKTVTIILKNKTTTPISDALPIIGEKTIILKLI